MQQVGTDVAMDEQRGRRRVLITGAGSGIGLATAKRLSAAGDMVTCVLRPVGTASIGPLPVRTVSCDLSRPAEVCRLASGELAKGLPLDVLFANAACQPWQRTLTPEGLELGFATSVLRTYLLIQRLLPALSRSPAPVILITGSLVHAWGRYELDALARGEDFDPNQSYYAAKLAQMQLVTYFAEQLRPQGIAVHAVEPGMTRTGFARDFRGFYRMMSLLWRPFMRSAADVAADVERLLARDDLMELSGSNWHRGARKPLSSAARDPSLARDLISGLEALMLQLEGAPM